MQIATVPYGFDGRAYEAYLADGSLDSPAPGVLVAHEAGGMTEHVRERARMLAQAGYVALAMDIFGEPVRDRAHAMALMAALNADPVELARRAENALGVLRGLDAVDASRTAAIGFCFGGTTVLELARSGSDVACVVGFHSILSTIAPARPGTIRSRVLTCIGARDPLIPLAQRTAFEAEMTEAGADWSMLLIGNAGHSFTNRAADGTGMPGFAYDAAADNQAWRAMLTLFDQAFTAH